MTPMLRAVWDELVARAAAEPWQQQARTLRERFGQLCGRFDADHPAAAARDAAAWEDVLVRGGLARAIAARLEDAAEREQAIAFARAQRGVWILEARGADVIALDLWGGAELLVLPKDDIGRELARVPVADAAPCQARLMATPEGCAVLPGTVFHPAEARGAIEDVLSIARERGMPADAALDALLRMEHAYKTHVRVKVGHAYREAGLADWSVIHGAGSKT